MSYRIETIAGQVFINVPGLNGARKTLTPLAAIHELKMSTARMSADVKGVEAEAEAIVKAMRTALADGTDTLEYRKRMQALKAQNAELGHRIEAAHQQISSIRSAATKAEAEAMSADAASRIAATLSTIAIGDHLHA